MWRPPSAGSPTTRDGSASGDPHGVDTGDYVYTVNFTYRGRRHRVRHLVECHVGGAYGAPVAPPFPTLYGFRLPDGAGIAVKARYCGSEVMHHRTVAGPFSPVLLYFPDVGDLSEATMYPDPVRQPPADGPIGDLTGWVDPADAGPDASDVDVGFLSAEVTHDGLRKGSPVPGACDFLGRWEHSDDEATAKASGDWPWVRFKADHARASWGMSWGGGTNVEGWTGRQAKPGEGVPYRHGMPDIVGFRYDAVSRKVSRDPGLDGTARCGKAIMPYVDHGHGDVILDTPTMSGDDVFQVVHVPTYDRGWLGGF